MKSVWRLKAARWGVRTLRSLPDHCTLAPDRIFGVWIGAACRDHDRDYAAGIERSRADWRLYWRIRMAFNAAGKPRRGWVVAGIYWLAVRTFGWAFWRRAQIERKRRERRTRTTYQTP